MIDPSTYRQSAEHDALVSQLCELLDALDLDESHALLVFDHEGQLLHARGALPELLGRDPSKLPATFEQLHHAADKRYGAWQLEPEHALTLAELMDRERGQQRVKVRTASRSWTLDCRWRTLRLGEERRALLCIYKAAPRPLRSDLLARWPQIGLLRCAQEHILWADATARSMLPIEPPCPLPLDQILALRLPDELRGHEPDDCPILHALRTDDASEHAALRWLDHDHGARLLYFHTRPAEQDGSHLISVQDVTEVYLSIQRREEFLSIASHELRAPLTPLRGFMQMALNAHRQGEQVLDLLERADSQLYRMTRLVEVLLDLTRVESGRMTRGEQLVSLDDLLQRVLHTWAPPTASRITLELGAEPVSVQGDPLALEQVVINLLDNAFKFSPPDAPVTARLTTRDDLAILQIEDRGPGIDAQVRARIFDRFFQGPQTQRDSGVGLGLYISRQIVEEHGGHIQVSGDNSRGAVIEVCLPLSDSARGTST
jgi:signal transduction histidine kinase